MDIQSNTASLQFHVGKNFEVTTNIFIPIWYFDKLLGCIFKIRKRKLYSTLLVTMVVTFLIIAEYRQDINLLFFVLRSTHLNSFEFYIEFYPNMLKYIGWDYMSTQPLRAEICHVFWARIYVAFATVQKAGESVIKFQSGIYLTHWGRVIHICVANWFR